MPALACFVIGTRAQLVKMAPVLASANAMGVPFRVWFSGQHGESMEDMLNDFGLHTGEEFYGEFAEKASVSSLILWLPAAVRNCVAFLKQAKADFGNRVPMVVVHGDTLSALIGAVAAKIVRAPVAHVESGLSSGSLLTPFPEEVIRRMIFWISDVAYCPNIEAAEVMSRFAQVQVVRTEGNTIVDSLRMALDGAAPVSSAHGRLAVFSIHRFENIYSRERLAKIVEWILEAASCHDVLFVLHPATTKRLESGGWLEVLRNAPGITLSARMPYSRFVSLLGEASVVITDGGSNQEELACLGIPTILLRNRSERPDGLGENAILECDLDCSVGKYLSEGRYRDLVRDSCLSSKGRPSEQIVLDLRRRIRKA